MRILIAFILTLLFVVPSAVGRTDPTPSPSLDPAITFATERIDTMLRTGHAVPAWFSQSFLDQLPASKVDEVIVSLTSTLGKYERLEFTPERFIAHFEKGTDDVLVHFDADNKIDALFFKPPSNKTLSLDDTLQDLQPATGTLSYIITEEGRSPRAGLNPSLPLAVGSSFKLAVLNALLDETRNGKRHWNDIVPLAKTWKSEPSGELQDWPSGTPITIASYAGQMISISDNTAADALAHLVGNDIAPYAGRNAPFLTTREIFILKANGAQEVRSAYLAAMTSSERSKILARVDAMQLPPAEQLLATPELNIEWHYSVSDLCKMMERVADLPIMSINPGAADPSDFRHVAYKGGSDVGVLNMTTMVTTRRGSKICFSATLNDPKNAIVNRAFGLKYAAVLHEIAAL